MKSKSDKIQSVVEFLQDLPTDEISSAIFVSDENYGKSILIGTQDFYIHMAIKLLKIAQADTSPCRVGCGDQRESHHH